MRVTDKYVLFWTAKDIYSNFYKSDFTHQGILFKWSEQAIMYRKALLFGATDIANEILKASDPQTCKMLGRSRKIPFDNDVWTEHREQIFKEVLLDKFNEPSLRQAILNTGDRQFVEASPYDTIWGIGLRENHKDATNPKKWRGLNLLGKVLDEVKKELREQ